MWISFEKRLRAWVDNGLLTEDSAARIAAFERTRSGSHWGPYAIVGIGATALLTGLLSLVAANWESLSDTVKLGLYFSLQGGLGVLVARYEGKSGAPREACLALFAFAFLLGIALIGQLYHLSGPAYETLGFWLLLAFGPTCIANSGLLPIVWCLTALWAGGQWGVESLGIGSEFGRWCVVAALPFLMAAVGLWFDGQSLGSGRFRSSLKGVGLGSLMVIATPWLNSAVASGEDLVGEGGDVSYLVIPWLAVVAGVVASLRRERNAQFPRRLTAALLLVLAAWLTVPVVYPLKLVLSPVMLEILGAVAFLSVWAVAAAASARAGWRRLFDVCTLVIGARFVVVYFEVFGDMTMTGIGLIISGTVMLCAGLAWVRLRAPFERLLSGGAR